MSLPQIPTRAIRMTSFEIPILHLMFPANETRKKSGSAERGREAGPEPPERELPHRPQRFERANRPQQQEVGQSHKGVDKNYVLTNNIYYDACITPVL